MVLTAFLLVPNFIVAKDKVKLSKAQKLQHQRAYNLLELALYDDAIKEYDKLLEMRGDYDQFLFETGIVYLKSPKSFNQAQKYFERALKYSGSDTITELFYYLAKAYQVNHNFADAKKAYSEFVSTIKQNKKGQELTSIIQWDIKTCQHGQYHVKLNKKNPLENKKMPLNNLKKYFINATDFVVLQNMGGKINSVFDDEAAVFLKNETEIFFTSKRNPFGTATDLSSSFEYTYEHVYSSKKISGDWKTPYLLKSANLFSNEFKIDEQTHISIVSINKAENLLFLYKSGKLFESKLQGVSWTVPTELPEHINLKKSHEPTVCIADDGNMIIVVSDKKGGYGGRDLYTSKRTEDGSWGPLENMGAVINTEQDEDTPYLTGEDLLYFSSKGHSSIGGYDVFFSELKNEKWKNPISLGIPINTPGDEISYVRSKLNKEVAYYSSSRLNGYGYLDIYRVTAHIEKRRDLLPDILLADLMADALAKKVVVEDTEVIAVVEEVVEEVKVEEPVIVKVEKKTPTPTPEDLFRDILFKFNKMEIADDSKEQIRKISEYMKANLKYVVNLSGHADYLGSDDINEQVSKQRALVVYNELIKVGVDPYSLHYDYFGETKPKANSTHADGSDNASNRSQNRRVDFQLEQLDMFRHITFASSSSTLNEKAIKALNEAVAYSKANPNVKIDLRGFSDPSGPAATNMILSEKRAQTAVNYLIAQGVSKSLIFSKAFGETVPTPPNMPIENMRTVEIRIQ